MPRYLFSGTSPQGEAGQGVHQQANTVGEARKELAAAGWSQLELQSDEILFLVQKATAEASDPELQVEQTAAQELKGVQGRFDGFLMHVLRGWVSDWSSTLIALAFVAGGLWLGRIWMVVAGAAWMLFTPALAFWFGQSSQWFDRLQAAKTRGRWNDVIRCVQKLRRTGGRTGIAVPEFELERNHALALAGMGRLEDALEKWAPFCGTPEMPEWLFLMHKAGLLEAGKEFERARAARIRALELKPDHGISWVDLAMIQAMRFGDSAAAREALAKARQCELPALCRPYLNFTEGLIRWRESALQEARPLMEHALAACQAHPNRVVWESFIRIIEAHLGIVAGGLGDVATARRLYRTARPYLEAHREADLLAALRSAATL